MRTELDELREQYSIIMQKFKSEKVSRQSLESNKLKYIMLKELQQNAGTIEDQTFFDNQRNANSSMNGNFRNQVSFFNLTLLFAGLRAT